MIKKSAIWDVQNHYLITLSAFANEIYTSTKKNIHKLKDALYAYGTLGLSEHLFPIP